MADESGRFSVSRRQFLAAAALAAGTLAIGFRLRSGVMRAEAPEKRTINSWITIAPDESVTIYAAKEEMGQGIHTAMAMLVAEELEVEWERVRVAPAPLLPEYFLGDFPVTSGSRSILFAFEPLREAGAVAREMLVATAAAQWKVSPGSCFARGGYVFRKDTEEKISYGKLAPSAARLTPPPVPPLKPEKDWRLVGRATSQLGSPAVVLGASRYSIDVHLPGMLVAAVRTSPVFGGELTNLEELRAGLPAGVQLLPVKNGLAAVSGSYWLSQRTLDSLRPSFTAPATSSTDSSAISASLWRRLERASQDDLREHRPPPQGMKVGRIVSADYEVPYLAHATMEPPVCTADVKDGRCDLWLGHKAALYVKTTAARFLELPLEKVNVFSLPMGGSFGRKGETDFVLQALTLSQQLKRPVKLIWSREEDIQHDFYRPAAVARMAASLNEANNDILLWDCVNVVATRASPGDIGADHLNGVKTANFAKLDYELPYTRVRSAVEECPVPVGFWRSTAASYNTFFVESFIDELAHAIERDPLSLRLRLLSKSPKKAAVLKAAAKLAAWGRSLPPGLGLGLAFEEIRGTQTALVAEVESDGSSFRVRKLFCAYDCGPVVNPAGVEAQLQGALAFGLSACLFGRITIAEGKVQQGNFHDYPVLQMHDCPEIKLVRVESGSPVSGMGEVGVALVGPAVANALFRASGRRLRRLPMLPVESRAI